jgi:hypothetical protein
MKSWFSKFLRKQPGSDSSQLIRLRTARFRHFLRQYGQIVALRADAAEKQSGEYILDKAYILFLIDNAFEAVQGMIYDLNVLAGQRYTGLYDAADSIRQRALALFREESASTSLRDDKEEPEYWLLRRIRETLFAEFVAHSDDDSPGTSLFEVVQSGQKSAGESVAALMQSLTTLPGPAKAAIKTSVMDLMKGLTESDGASLLADPFSTDSMATHEFLAAFFSSEAWEGRSRDSADLNSAAVAACSLEDSMNAVLFHNEGYDLFDAFLSCAPEANYIYCRFPPGDKALVAERILGKLGFSTSGTKHELTGWISGQPSSETASKLRAIAKMAAFLLPPYPTGPGLKAEDEADRFLRHIA